MQIVENPARRSDRRLAPTNWLRCLALCLLIMLGSSPALAIEAGQPAAEPLRFGITQVFLVDQNDFLPRWKRYLEPRLGRSVRFVRRKSYAEISDMLLNGQLDAAWICSFPYVFDRSSLRLVAVPEFQGKPYYRSYLIVPAGDHASKGYDDLRGKVFAYAEPRSNTGYQYPRYVLMSAGYDPDTFFRKTFFAWSHPDVLTAVADGLADAGAMDGYIWEVMRRGTPALTARTRVIARSQQFGFPPVVAGVFMDDDGLTGLRAVLLAMDQDPEGRALLKLLYLDRFVAAPDGLYDNLLPIMESVFKVQ